MEKSEFSNQGNIRKIIVMSVIVGFMLFTAIISLRLLNVLTVKERVPVALQEAQVGTKGLESGFRELSGPDATATHSGPITLADIFNDIEDNDDARAERVTLIATGDVMTGRSVNVQALKRGDFRWAFSEVSAFLSAADITLINLETPLLSDCPATDEGMVFCSDAKHTEGLMAIGTDVVSVANNHAYNHGLTGLDETESHLSGSGMQVAGRGKPVLIERKGTSFAFLAFNDIGIKEQGIDWAYEDEVASQIKSVRPHAGSVIVSFHWGEEYIRMPTPRQRRLAHLAIDAGADLIIGNHPHWYQPAEMYRGKLIVYSHGNFVFDQMWSKETMTGIIGEYGFISGKLASVRFIPIGIRDWGQAYFLEGPEHDTVSNVMKQSSEELEKVAASE